MKQKTKSIIQPLKDLFTALCITCTIAIKSRMTANFYFCPLIRENVAWKTINDDVTSRWWFCGFYESKMEKLGLITLVLMCRRLLDVHCHYQNLQPTIWVLCQCSVAHFPLCLQREDMKTQLKLFIISLIIDSGKICLLLVWLWMIAKI